MRLPGFLAGIGLAAVALFSPASAGATTTYTITSNDPEPAGDCGLAEAVLAANNDSAFGECAAGSGNDVINVTATGTISLMAGLSITSNIDINGPGSGQLDVHRDGSAGNFRVVNVSNTATDASISDLTISNGRTTSFSVTGSGVGNFGTLVLDHVVVRDNTVDVDEGVLNPSPDGGGIVNAGAMTIRDSTVRNNLLSSSQTATSGAVSSDTQGAGVFNTGTLTIERSTVSNNTSTADVASNDPSADALAVGGGIAGQGGTITVRASTIANNTTSASAPAPAITATRGGGIYSLGTLTAVGDTIANNSADLSASVSNQGTETITDSILVNNISQSTPNCDGAVDTDGGFNISYPTGCAGLNASLVNPLLQSLDDYGGPTKTMALGVGSPAIDAGIASGNSFDQRGITRPQDLSAIANAPGGDGADVGALEALDADGDGIPDEVDFCAGAPGNGSPSGCPDAPRELTLKYSTRKKRFKGKLLAPTAAACADGRTVTIFRKHAGEDPEIGQATTSPSGRYSLDKRARRGKYYSEAEEEVVAETADCLAVISPTVKVN